MRQDDDRGCVIRLHLRERFLRPRDDQLVRARDSIPRRELASRVGDDRMPAEALCRGAQRFGRVDGAVDEETWRRSEDVREHAVSFELDDTAVTCPDQLVGALLLAVENKPLRSVIEIGEDDGAVVGAHDLRQAFEQSGIRLVDPHVDLPAARPSQLIRRPPGVRPRGSDSVETRLDRDCVSCSASADAKLS